MKRTVFCNGVAYDMIFRYVNKRTGEEVNIPEKQKEKLEEQFLDLRDEYCKIVNPKYETWNGEWDEMSGTNTITDENREEYNRFIAKKQNRYLQLINGQNLDKGIMLKTDLEEDCDICGIIKGINVQMNMYLKKM